MADILITLTSVGTDQGPLFDLYSDADGFSSAFDSNVSEASLLSGYTTSSAPAGTLIVRVCGQGVKCSRCIDLSVNYTTTTSTTTIVLEKSTISSTTDVADACLLTLNTTAYIDTFTNGQISVGDTVYSDAAGNNIIVGNGEYYAIRIDSVPGTIYSAKIDASGIIQTPISICA